LDRQAWKNYKSSTERLQRTGARGDEKLCGSLSRHRKTNLPLGVKRNIGTSIGFLKEKIERVLLF
jgi:hypothetical protein